ncbi:MAG: DUF460 domain-containing protein [Candidatus Aenigmarchaeota archaeon]|nr:DUF460 domain-containing protein [Candidatus Aenigmarchaeota archaeon]
MDKIRVIAGIDPGMTTGVAAISLSGDIIGITSKKDFRLGEIIEFIASLGKPVIVSTDRKDAPELARKIASSFSAALCSPPEDMKEEEKAIMTKGMYRDSHERDSLASAIYAKSVYQKIMDKIDRSAGTMGLSDYADRIKDLVIRGEARNIAEAMDKCVPRTETKAVQKERGIDSRYVKRLESQVNKYKSLTSDIDIFERELDVIKLRKQVSDLEVSLKKQALRADVAERKSKLLSLLMKAQMERAFLVVPLGQEEGLPGTAIYVNTPSRSSKRTC